jgi:hypothetical protein
MIVLICGDRNWNNFKIIDKFLDTLPPDATILEGDCRGADKISGYLARQRGMEVITEPADWEADAKMAGPIRNQRMLDKYEVNLVVAFHNDISNSKGTKDMVLRARKANIEVKIIKE